MRRSVVPLPPTCGHSLTRWYMLTGWPPKTPPDIIAKARCGRTAPAKDLIRSFVVAWRASDRPDTDRRLRSEMSPTKAGGIAAGLFRWGLATISFGPSRQRPGRATLARRCNGGVRCRGAGEISFLRTAQAHILRPRCPLARALLLVSSGLARFAIPGCPHLCCALGHACPALCTRM
jgi:hypothetical protein